MNYNAVRLNYYKIINVEAKKYLTMLIWLCIIKTLLTTAREAEYPLSP